MANEKKKTSIGGQALIEGIMMRGPFLTSMATRLPDGSIDVETWNTHKGGQKAHWTRRVPFLRGIFNMVDSMVVGYGCLMKSAEKAGVEEEPIFQAAARLLRDEPAYRAMAHAVNPYGDGHTSQRIVQIILDWGRERRARA